MKKSINLLFIIAICLIAMLPNVGFAISAYDIDNVEVELGAGNPAVRREQAISDATKKGLEILLRNLTPRHVWSKHAVLMEKIRWDVVLEKFVVIEETTSPAYHITLNLTYNQDYIRSILTAEKIPYSEVSPVKALTFPLIELGARKLLWEEANPWKSAFDEISKNESLVSLVLPLGDPEEMAEVTPDLLIYGQGQRLGNMAKAYGVDDVLIAYARIVTQPDQRFVEVETRWYGKHAMKPVRVSVPFPQDSGFEDVLESAAKQVQLRLEQEWQGVALISADRPGKAFLRYTPKSAGDLERIKAILKNVNIVRNINLRLLGKKEAVLEVDYFGDIAGLGSALSKHEIALQPEGGLWRISFVQPIQLKMPELKQIQGQ